MDKTKKPHILTKGIIYEILAHRNRAIPVLTERLPVQPKPEEQKYWAWISGRSQVAVLFDRPIAEGGEPQFLARAGEENLQSAKGVHLGMLLQRLSGAAGLLPDFSYTCTADEAFKLVRREAAVYEFETLFLLVAEHLTLAELEVDTYQLIDESMQRWDVLCNQDGVPERIKELRLAEYMVATIRQHYDEEVLASFRQRMRRNKASAVETLFFGE